MHYYKNDIARNYRNINGGGHKASNRANHYYKEKHEEKEGEAQPVLQCSNEAFIKRSGICRHHRRWKEAIEGFGLRPMSTASTTSRIFDDASNEVDDIDCARGGGGCSGAEEQLERWPLGSQPDRTGRSQLGAGRPARRPPVSSPGEPAPTQAD